MDSFAFVDAFFQVSIRFAVNIVRIKWVHIAEHVFGDDFEVSLQVAWTGCDDEVGKEGDEFELAADRFDF